MFDSLDHWIVIALTITGKSKIEKDDKAFETILKGVEVRMSEKC